MKELEEKARQEEEARQRAEEEEAARLAELERQKEEAKRRKKEKEKERIAQLKKEGKYLTGKKKEEALRWQALRSSCWRSVRPQRAQQRSQQQCPRGGLRARGYPLGRGRGSPR